MTAEDRTLNPTLRYAHDVLVEAVEIVSYNGDRVDITALIGLIDIYESIFDMFLAGSIFVTDAIGLAEKFPIIGIELINIKFRTPIYQKGISKTFRVYKIDSRTHEKNDNVQHYNLVFMSVEAFRCLQTKVSRAYTGFHHEIIQNLFNDFLLTKEDEIGLEPSSIQMLEPARDSETIVFGTWNPARCFQYVSNRSRRNDNPSDQSYVFFENLDGFHFTTMSLLGTGEPISTYTRQIPNYIEPGSTDRNLLRSMNAIEELSIETQFDRAFDLKYGKLASQSYGYDPLTRTAYSQQYDYLGSFGTTERIQKNPVLPTGASVDLATAYGSNIRWVPIDGQREFEIDLSWAQNRNAQMIQHLSNRLIVTIPGNSILRAGMVVNVRVPSMTDSPDDPGDPLLSGRYIIHSIRHSIAENKDYKCFLVLGRNGIGIRFPNKKEPTRFDSSSAIGPVV